MSVWAPLKRPEEVAAVWAFFTNKKGKDVSLWQLCFILIPTGFNKYSFNGRPCEVGQGGSNAAAVQGQQDVHILRDKAPLFQWSLFKLLLQ